MDDIPLSQPSQSSTPIFVNPDGSPMQIFVEAGGVNNRPALVRKLRKSGANISIDPKTAQIILVDDDTDQGRHFIRDWGRDENKVVLKHLWVEKCRVAGRTLTSQDDWGGCLTVDDGLPLGTEIDEASSTNKSPLPTPRETPVSNVRVTPQHSQTPVSSHSRTSSVDTPIPPIGPSHMNASQQASSFSAHPTDNHFAMPSSLQPFEDLTSGGFQSQMAMTHAGMPPYPPHNGMVQIPPQLLAGLMTNPQFGSALADAMRSYAGRMTFTGSPGQQYLMQPSAYNSPASFSAGLDDADLNNTSQLDQDEETKIRNLAPSISRKAGSSSPSSAFESLKSKGKQRAISPSPARKPRMPQVASSVTISPAPVIVSRIFTHQNGQELSFYVQVELHNRKDVVTAIKKNGGKITSELASADYVILQTRGTDFIQLRNAAAEVGAPAITANFVFECAKQVKLLDHQPYLHDKPKKRGRKLSESNEDSDNAHSEEEREKKRLMKNQKQREYAKRKKEGPARTPHRAKSTHLPESSQNIKKSSPTQPSRQVAREPRSPSPPPSHTRELLPGSKNYKYSEHERKYALDYAKVLLQRDHKVSYSAIAVALHKKMRHHTLLSWKTFVSRDMADQIDELRRKASIAYRKALSQREVQDVQAKPRETSPILDSVDAHTEPVPLPSGINNTAAESVTSYSDLEEEDLTTLVNYFVFGGGDEDGQDDAEVWAQLKAKASCKSAPSWEEFWNKHSIEVNKRYEALVSVQPLAPTEGS